LTADDVPLAAIRWHRCIDDISAFPDTQPSSGAMWTLCETPQVAKSGPSPGKDRDNAKLPSPILFRKN